MSSGLSSETIYERQHSTEAERNAYGTDRAFQHYKPRVFRDVAVAKGTCCQLCAKTIRDGDLLIGDAHVSCYTATERKR